MKSNLDTFKTRKRFGFDILNSLYYPIKGGEKMKIEWYGHACFLITSKENFTILCDPYDDSIGYKMNNVSADVLLVSHSHYDHNYTRRALGNPYIIKKEGATKVKEVTFKAIPSFHDKNKGKDRGNNLIFSFELEKINVCHLGDLGEVLTLAQINSIGKVDILMVPVGGTFTIDANEANKVCDQLKPKVIIPMHYKTPALKFFLDGVDKFLAGKRNVKKINSTEIDIDLENLPKEEEIIVLDYAG